MSAREPPNFNQSSTEGINLPNRNLTVDWCPLLFLENIQWSNLSNIQSACCCFWKKKSIFKIKFVLLASLIWTDWENTKRSINSLTVMSWHGDIYKFTWHLIFVFIQVFLKKYIPTEFNWAERRLKIKIKAMPSFPTLQRKFRMFWFILRQQEQWFLIAAHGEANSFSVMTILINEQGLFE